MKLQAIRLQVEFASHAQTITHALISSQADCRISQREKFDSNSLASLFQGGMLALQPKLCLKCRHQLPRWCEKPNRWEKKKVRKFESFTTEKILHLKDRHNVYNTLSRFSLQFQRYWNWRSNFTCICMQIKRKIIN